MHDFIFLFLSYLSLSSFCFSISPYAPKGIGAEPTLTDIAAYQYDAAGARLVDTVKDQTIRYGLISKPVVVNTPGIGTEVFKYASDGRHYLRMNAYNQTTLYVGDMECRIVDGEAEHIYYIRNGGYSPIAQMDTDNSACHYYVQDHQGSVLVAINGQGEVESREQYDPWGVPVTSAGVLLSQNEVDENIPGYTGHETIKSAGLIHAKGRVLDPKVGFISPDPILFNDNILSHNRYAYGLNNPLLHTDPSGYAPAKKQLLQRYTTEMAAAIKLQRNMRIYLSNFRKSQRRLREESDYGLLVPQGHWGIQDEGWIGTCSLGTCIGIHVVDQGKRTFVAHVDGFENPASIGSAIRAAFPDNRRELQAAIIGGENPDSGTINSIEQEFVRLQNLGYSLSYDRWVEPNASTEFNSEAGSLEILWDHISKNPYMPTDAENIEFDRSQEETSWAVGKAIEHIEQASIRRSRWKKLKKLDRVHKPHYSRNLRRYPPAHLHE